MIKIIDELIDMIEQHKQTTVFDRMMVETVRTHDLALYDQLEKIKQQLDSLNI